VKGKLGREGHTVLSLEGYDEIVKDESRLGGKKHTVAREVNFYEKS
jgi:hypothetical protein